MSRDKQMFNDLVEIFDEEYGRRNLITPQNTAEKLSAKGYRKSTEVAEEVIGEVVLKAKAIFCPDCDYDVADIRYALDWLGAELKKKYIGKDTNVPTKTEDK